MNYTFHSVSQMKYNYIIRTATMQVSASIGYDKALIGAKSGDFAQGGLRAGWVEAIPEALAVTIMFIM